ncbi:MAG: protein translocase SEC61 complex subunit gamma [archaeon]
MSKLAELGIKTKSFVKECKRVLLLTKKPSKEEFKIIVKVTAAGMVLIGLIGFVINMLGKLLSW